VGRNPFSRDFPFSIFHLSFAICYLLRIRPPPIGDPMDRKPPNDQCQMENDKWKMTNGKWQMENNGNDKWTMVRGK
jgi:hypothetical protein